MLLVCIIYNGCLLFVCVLATLRPLPLDNVTLANSTEIQAKENHLLPQPTEMLATYCGE